MFNFLRLALLCPLFLSSFLTAYQEIPSPSYEDRHVNEDSETIELAEQILKKIAIFQAPYFKDLQSKKMSLKEFRYTQKQFVNIYESFEIFYVLSEKMPELFGDPETLEEVKDLAESGLGSSEIKAFLISIGCTPKELNNIRYGESITTFQKDLVETISIENSYFALGCMGMIEYIFEKTSSLIGKTVVERNWTTKEELIFYTFEEEEKFNEFFEYAEINLEKAANKEQFIQGLKQGASLYQQLIEGLYQEAKNN